MVIQTESNKMLALGYSIQQWFETNKQDPMISKDI